MIELIVAATIVVVVLGIASIFLGRQVQIQRSVQAKNDVQDRVRVAMQLVTQDLALVGNRVLVDPTDGSTRDVSFGCFDPDTSSTSCLTLTNVSATESVVELRYLSSQFPTAEACRDVAYRVSDGTLQRSDVSCPSDGTIGDPVWIDLAPGVLGFKVLVACSNGTRFATFPNGSCSGLAGYGRSALTSFGASSEPVTTSAGTPVDIVTTTAGSPTNVACPDDRACFAMTQETLMPNLKDQ